MKKAKRQRAPRFIKHQFPISADRLVTLKIPLDLTYADAKRIGEFVRLLAQEKTTPAARWPFNGAKSVEDEDFLEDELMDLDEFEDLDDIEEEELADIILTEEDLEPVKPNQLQAANYNNDSHVVA
jgi:hypothetical protein